MASREEWAFFHWGQTELVLTKKEAKVDVNGMHKAILTSPAAGCSRMYFDVQQKLENVLRRIARELDIEENGAMNEVCIFLVRHDTDVV